jgi:hypothetical protein
VSRSRVILLFALGLAARLAFLGLGGMDDMQAYLRWGRAANERGLAAAYSGIYFPLQWQVFQGCDWIARLSGLPARGVIGGVTLAFELGLLGTLALLLRRQGSAATGALVYWLHPSFLMFSALGYIDAQMAVFVLLAGLLADRAASTRSWTLAGVPLGLALLMKPQALGLTAIAFLYCVVRLLRAGERRTFALFAAPALLFVSYSALLVAGGRGPWDLTLSYLEIPAVMPTLSANQLNLWCPVAWLVDPGRPLYWVPDTHHVLGALSVRQLAATAAIGLLALFAVLVGRLDTTARQARPGRWTLLFASAALVVPMVMTNAHENHFFLAGLYLVLLLPFARGGERLALHTLLALSGINLLGLYGLGTSELTAALRPLMALRTPVVVAVGGALAAVCFSFVAAFELSLCGLPRGRRPWLVGAAVLCSVLALQAVVVLGWPRPVR